MIINCITGNSIQRGSVQGPGGDVLITWGLMWPIKGACTLGLEHCVTFGLGGSTVYQRVVT